ncbi:TonB family protein [Phycisphaerales bacterium AB-hyl4]|uniref:TonB family protein n=1 Tax=Natronomicrosphaera hydrolytica TaxID=3242702 RepID=A0ABV4UAJ1_9BACT
MSDSRWTSRTVRRVLFAGGATVVVNALLLLSLELINRPTPAVVEEGALSRVRLAALPEPVVEAEEPEDEPEPMEDEVFEEPTVDVDLPQPTVEPLDLPTPSLDVTVRVPPSVVRDVPTSVDATEVVPRPSEPAAARRGPMREGEVDVGPRPIRNPQPPYPPAAQRRGVEGYVVAQLLVDTSGQVREVRVTDRRGPPSFERAVMETLQGEWSFEPGEHEGRAVATWTSVRIDFRIQ